MRTGIITISIILCAALLPAQSLKHVYKIEALIKRMSKPDTIYVVNFWATWCKPCVLELPAFDSLYVQTKNQPLKIILVSLDFKEDIDKKVNPFLKQKGIKSECVLLDEVNGNDFINQISEKWTGAIPATLIKKGDKSIFLEQNLNLLKLQNEVRDLK